jgi:hypothetical protein
MERGKWNERLAWLLAFLTERIVWLVFGLLAPFAVPILLPEVRAMLFLPLLWQPDDIEYLWKEIPMGLLAPAYVLFVVGLTVYGPVVWNRERVRGRGNLAEIKALSQYEVRPATQKVRIPEELK